MQRYPAYKASGIEWLGEIPAHWEVKKLKYFSEIVNGSTPQTGNSEYWDGGNIVWLTPNDLGKADKKTIDDSARKITEKGLKICGTSLTPPDSIVLSTRAPIGHIAITTVSSCTNQGCRTIVPALTLCDVNYVYYLLYSQKEELQSLGQGSTFTELSGQNLGNFKMPFPGFPEQQAIAAYLDHKTRLIDTYITKKQQQVERWQAYRTALINQAVTRGLNPDALMKASDIEWLGDIPAHWEIVRLKHLLLDGNDGIKIGPFGSSLKSDIIKEEGFKVYGQENVIKNDFTAGHRYIDDDKFLELNAYELFPGDIVITMMGTMGKSKVVPQNIEKGIMDSHLIRIRVNPAYFNPELISLLINDSNYIFTQTKLQSRGSIMEGLNSSIIKSLLFIVPPLQEQRAIAAYLDEQTAKIDTLAAATQRQLERLHAYRAALISEVVTGKIDVRATETL